MMAVYYYKENQMPEISDKDTNKQNNTDVKTEKLFKRINELYHDLQASEFEDVHRLRHNVERIFWESEVAPILSQMGAKSGVDLCTGTGFVPRTLFKKMGDTIHIFCVDISSKALDHTKSLLKPYAHCITAYAGDAASIPLPDREVDWISLNAGLHHIPDPAAVLVEVDRILREGGVLCLGFEPNKAFFSSRFLSGLERLVWHVFWYISPRNNWRRLYKILGFRTKTYEQSEHLDAINKILLEEKLIDNPLTTTQLRQMVDIHTHSEEEHEDKTGFDPEELIATCFPGYQVEKIIFSDYGGEMLRKHFWLRKMFDGIMRRLFPGKGRLFSWIIRKPFIKHS
jgi:ubiquinone/menaquinone biosynthesis C-methylase UbiE